MSNRNNHLCIVVLVLQKFYTIALGKKRIKDGGLLKGA